MSKENNPIRDEKLKKLTQLRQMGIDPYPHTFYRDTRLKDLRDKFDKRLDAGDVLEKDVFSLAGRMMTKRPMGKAAFLDIRDEKDRLQIYLKKNELDEESLAVFENLDIGDIIGIKGFVFKTKKSELSLRAQKLTMLCKTLEPLADKYHGLTNIEHRYRYRHMDLVMNYESKDVFRKRSKVISLVREFLDSKGFLEVETPVLQPIYGGASASPFVTHHKTLDIELFLKISPELYLKRLIVGGFEKVYEIGKNFRNEGIDRSHNPEFTMLEFYEAYTDYNYQMNQFEDLVGYVVEKICGTKVIEYQGKELNFSKPWKKLSVCEAIKNETGLDVKTMSIEALYDEVKKIESKIKAGKKKGELIMDLFEAKVEPKLWQPTFIVDFPKDVSPLTKTLRSDDTGEWVERFEPMVAGMELGNAYSELNDPEDQRQRLIEQEKRRVVDEEAQPMDKDFLHAVDTGLPPTGGVGLGIERLVMIVTNQASIRDILFFPTMKIQE